MPAERGTFLLLNPETLHGNTLIPSTPVLIIIVTTMSTSASQNALLQMTATYSGDTVVLNIQGISSV